MSYRPITDMWILARAKLKNGHKYYGAYPGGFLERARVLMGVNIREPLLHVCGGRAKSYPYANAFGPKDETMDMDDLLEPTYVHDVRFPFPPPKFPLPDVKVQWHAIIADPPYTPADAANYRPGGLAFPSPNQLLKNCIDAVKLNGRVGMLHYVWPSPPKNARSVAAVGVLVGFNNRIRIFSVFERTS